MAPLRAGVERPGLVRRRGRMRMTARLAVELFVLAVLVTAACAWTALVLVEETLRQSTEDELSEMVKGIARAVDARRADVGSSLQGVEEALLADTQLLERFLTEDPGLAREATRLANRYPLGFLEILNDQGKILSHFPDEEKIGLSDDGLGEVEAVAKLFTRSADGVEKLFLLARGERRPSSVVTSSRRSSPSVRRFET